VFDDINKHNKDWRDIIPYISSLYVPFESWSFAEYGSGRGWIAVIDGEVIRTGRPAFHFLNQFGEPVPAAERRLPAEHGLMSCVLENARTWMDIPDQGWTALVQVTDSMMAPMGLGPSQEVRDELNRVAREEWEEAEAAEQLEQVALHESQDG
ncbi:uncharacterized protein BDZ99DRAFT_517049, partial [Mytilinidion resinicola]